MKPSDISVVIPARNENAVIGAAVRSALDAGAGEVIVSDGGSQDATVQSATAAGASRIIDAPPGRGTQLSYGANSAGGEFVLFLHADNQLGADCLQQICDARDAVWGAFRQRIDSPRRVFRLLETGNAMRVQWRRMPFGDQAIFVNRIRLNEHGGIAEIPLMEDVELSRRLRRVSRPVLLDGPVIVNPAPLGKTRRDPPDVPELGDSDCLRSGYIASAAEQLVSLKIRYRCLLTFGLSGYCASQRSGNYSTELTIVRGDSRQLLRMAANTFPPTSE